MRLASLIRETLAQIDAHRHITNVRDGNLHIFNGHTLAPPNTELYRDAGKLESRCRELHDLLIAKGWQPAADA